MTESVFCSKCGAQHTSEQNFCSNCGAPLALNTVPASNATVPASNATTGKRKSKGRGCLLLVGALLLILFVRAISDGNDTTASQSSSSLPVTAATIESDNDSVQADIQPTDIPTDAPEPEIETGPTAGLGVTREAVQSVYEKPSVGFSFEESTAVRGQPRVMGQSSNQIAMLELIGPPDDITKATIIVGVPNDNQQVVAENTVYLLGLPKTVMPDWDESTAWVTEALQKAAETGDEITTVRGNRHVKLSFSRQLGMVTLSVTAQE